MGMPSEVRITIWHLYYNEVERPLLRYAADFGGGIETSADIKTGLVYSCKQIYAEAWPILLASTQLHIIYMSHSPRQLAIPPPKCLRDQVREIWFHCPRPGPWGIDRPPLRPVKFHEFPKLATFRVCRSMSLNLHLLQCVNTSDEDITPALYQSLSTKEKLAMWKRPGILSGSKIIQDMSAFGRGGWLSRIIDPRTFDELLQLNPDSDSECDGDDWEGWSDEVSWTDETCFHETASARSALNTEEDLSRFRSIIKRMHTLVEVELQVLYIKEDTQLLDTLVAVIDGNTKEIIELAIPNKEEMGKREIWSAEAT